jgi:hypothetical protein
MQSTENLQNTISSSIKEKVIISKTEQQPKSRGEVAAQEQVRILGQAMTASKAQPQVPQSRGEVGAQEQKRIVQLDAIQAFPTQREMDAIQAFNSSSSTGTSKDTKTSSVVAS